MALFSGKWFGALAKTREGIFGGISRILHGGKKLDPALLDSIEELLIQADLGMETVEDLMESLRSASQSEVLDERGAMEVLKDRLIDKMTAAESRPVPNEKPHVILVVGVNGTGKTTTIGKLAEMHRRESRRVLLACADTFRAAAAEQLGIWAERTGSDFIRQDAGADPAAVAFDAVDAALARGVDVAIIDTAGRLHSKANLMEELKKIRRVIAKRLPSAPHETLLVLDAVTGQNGLSQAKVFMEAAAVTGIVLTKLDGTARGGIVVAIQRELGIPVKWVGVGEGLDDLVPFDLKDFVEGMLGLGGEIFVGA
jgi:fused signal recognition particle receptor